MFGTGLVKRSVRAIATGQTQSRLGLQSPHLPNALVRLGRFAYTSAATVIAVTSYAAYVNERTEPGSGPKLVLPGTKKKKNDPARAERSPAFAAGTGQGTVTGSSPSAAGSAVKASGSVSGHPELKPAVSAVVATIMRQWPQLQITSTTSGNHVSNSFHYQGRAVDLAGSTIYMNQAASWIASHMASQLTEGIHNPGLSVKNGKAVPASFWGASTWAGHMNHIHIAV